MVKKIILFVLFATFCGCQKNYKELKSCKLQFDNSIAYTDGKIYSGSCNVFNNDTLLWKTLTYKRGKLTKEIGYYIPGGEVEYVGKLKNGIRMGDFIAYYPNGNVSIEGYLNDGVFDGDWIYYDDDGSLNKTLVWDKGVQLDSIPHK